MLHDVLFSAMDLFQASTSANTLDGRFVSGWITTSLYRIESDKDGKLNEVLVREWEKRVFSGENDKVDFKVDQAGQYRLVHQAIDEKGREVEGAIVY